MEGDFAGVGAHAEEHGNRVVDRQTEKPIVASAPRRESGDRKWQTRGDFIANLRDQLAIELALGSASVEVNLQAGEPGQLCGSCDGASGFGELLRRQRAWSKQRRAGTSACATWLVRALALCRHPALDCAACFDPRFNTHHGDDLRAECEAQWLKAWAN